MTELYHRHKESLPHNLNVSFASAVAAVIVFASAATTALAAAKNIVIAHGAWVPKSPLAAAIGYTLRNWVALTRYAEDGRLKIDNNGAEQALRPIVLGRKNWLFAGSEAGAHQTAILCSLVQTFKHLRVNPFLICAMSSSASRRIRRGWYWS